MFRKANFNDALKILEIYNQVIDKKTITADLTPANLETRKEWFEFHFNNEKYPLWVYELDNQIVAWCSYSPFYSRSAYDKTAEISFYTDKAFHGQGIGKKCVEFLIGEMDKYHLTTLIGFVFGNNQPSIGLLTKMGFKVWGELPEVADMGEHLENLVILGFKKSSF